MLRVVARSILVLSLGVVALPACKGKGAGDDGALVVAAAASLTDCFAEAGAAFTARTGTEVTFTFKSSGKLARQLAQGAPFDVFASANIPYLDEVIAEGAADADSRRIFAVGRLAIWVPEGAPPATVAELADPRYRRVGLANPEHAPYGTAGKQALAKAGVLSRVEGKLAFGSNVRQAMQFAESGNADAALTALSLVVAEPERYTLVDASLHAPLEQGIVVASASKKKDEARAFLAFLASTEGAAILEKYGLEARPDGR